MSSFVRMGEADFRNLLSLPEKVQRIVSILESFPISEKEILEGEKRAWHPVFSRSHYINLVESLILDLYGGVSYKEINPSPDVKDISSPAATYFLPDRSIGLWHEGCKRISFIFLYPNTILKLLDRGSLEFSLEKMGDLLRDMMFARNIIKQKTQKYHSKSLLILKMIINMTYGMWMSAFGPLVSRGLHKVPSYSGSILCELSNTERRNIIAINVDVIYLYKITNNVTEALKKIDIPYEIEEVSRILWTDKNRNLELDSTGRIIRDNLRKYDPNFGQKHFK